MASTYSTNLALELIGTGDQAGTWGNTTNTNLGTLIEQAISGYVTQAVATGTDTTITIPNGTTGVARNMYIELTGTGGTNTNLIVPANKKLYFIFNNSTGAVTVKVSGQTGVSVPQGKKVVLTSNGTDVVNGLNYIADFGSNSATITQLSATSATITNLTLTSLVISNLSIASANITTLTSASATITNLIGTTLNISGNSFLATSSGNVGIGTTSPANKLDINFSSSTVYSGTTDANTQFRIYNTSNTNGAFGSLRILTRNANDTAGAVNLVGISSSTDYAADFAVQQRTTGGNFQENLRLTHTGNLGIGTTSPSQKLHVASGRIAVTNGFNIGSTDGNTGMFVGTNTVNFQTNGNTVAQFDASGNLGLGVTPSAWSVFKTLQIGGNGAVNFSGTTGSMITNVFFDGTNYKYQNTSGAGIFDFGVATTGAFSWRIAASGTAGNNATFTQAMTLDSSGNLGIGTASPTYKLDVDRGASNGVVARFGRSSGQFAHIYADTASVYFGSDNGANTAWQFNESSDYLAAWTAGSERLRIDSSGNLGLGVTPSAWSGYKALQIGAGTSLAGWASDGGTELTSNAFYNGSNWIYIASAAATRYQITSTGENRWYTAASGTAGNAITFTQAMTLDASGNLGIGTTSPATRLEVAGASPILRLTDTTNSVTGGVYAALEWKTSDASASGGIVSKIDCIDDLGLYGDRGALRFFTHNSSSLGERARITSAGNVGIGTTNPGVNLEIGSDTSTVRALAVRYSSVPAYLSNSFDGTFGLTTLSSNSYNTSNGSASWSAFSNTGYGNAAVQIAVGTGGADVRFFTAAAANTNPTERARITAAGEFVVGTSDASATSGAGNKLLANGQYYGVMAASTNSDTTLQVYSTGAGAYRFYVGLGGTVYATNTTISAISDQRYKENIRDLDVGLDAILALKPRKFDWKAGQGKDIKDDRGFIAQEFEQVFPDLVDEWKDSAPEGEEPYKSVRQDLIPVLVKAIQELKAELDATKAKVAQLEAR